MKYLLAVYLKANTTENPDKVVAIESDRPPHTGETIASPVYGCLLIKKINHLHLSPGESRMIAFGKQTHNEYELPPWFLGIVERVAGREIVQTLAALVEMVKQKEATEGN